MRVEGFKWEKNTWPQTSCPQGDEEENKTKENTKSIMFVFHGHIFLARQLLGPIQGVQPQILWLIVRHYDISFRGPNCSF